MSYYPPITLKVTLGTALEDAVKASVLLLRGSGMPCLWLYFWNHRLDIIESSTIDSVLADLDKAIDAARVASLLKNIEEC